MPDLPMPCTDTLGWPRLKLLLVILFISGCCESALVSDAGSSDVPSEDAATSLDASEVGDDDPSNGDAGARPNPFEDADELGCSELPEMWFRELDSTRPAADHCRTEANYVLVETHVDCKEYGLGESTVAGCPSAIRADQEAVWTAQRDELADALCTARTLPICASFSLCPSDLAARCVDSRCRAL